MTPIIISFLMTSEEVAFSRMASSLTVMVSPTVMVMGFFWRSSWMRRSRSASVSRRRWGLRYCWERWLSFCFFTAPPSPWTRLEVCASTSNFSSYLPTLTWGVRVSMVRRSMGALGWAGCFCF